MRWKLAVILAVWWPLSLLIVYQLGAEAGRDDVTWTFPTTDLGIKVNCTR